MTNDEIRRNDEILMPKRQPLNSELFDIRALDFFRHSSFSCSYKSGSWSQCMRENEWRLSMDRPARTPPRGEQRWSVPCQFHSWEGSGVGQGWVHDALGKAKEGFHAPHRSGRLSSCRSTGLSSPVD